MQEISNYVSSLVTLIVAMTIIELILPNHNIKKYVMFSCSLVILLNVINPILKVFGLEINISEEINKIQNEMKTYENNSLTNYSLENNIFRINFSNRYCRVSGECSFGLWGKQSKQTHTIQTVKAKKVKNIKYGYRWAFGG